MVIRSVVILLFAVVSVQSGPVKRNVHEEIVHPNVVHLRGHQVQEVPMIEQEVRPVQVEVAPQRYVVEGGHPDSLPFKLPPPREIQPAYVRHEVQVQPIREEVPFERMPPPIYVPQPQPAELPPPNPAHKPAPKPASKPAPSASGSLKDEFLKQHNIHRAAFGLPKLIWADQLASLAQANVDTCKGDHDNVGKKTTNPKFDQIGQNLYASHESKAISPAKAAVDAVTMWMSEKKDYTYSTNSCKAGKACGHYTQVVWKNSTHVGCAMKRCNCSKCTYNTHVACNYGPPGNFAGEKPY